MLLLTEKKGAGGQPQTRPRIKWTDEMNAALLSCKLLLISKNLKNFVRKVDIQPSIAPDHNLIYLLLTWTKENPRGPGLWKFNNSLLAEEYSAKIHELYPMFREKLSSVEDKRLFWEMIKMEIHVMESHFKFM